MAPTTAASSSMPPISSGIRSRRAEEMAASACVVGVRGSALDWLQGVPAMAKQEQPEQDGSHQEGGYPQPVRPAGLRHVAGEHHASRISTDMPPT